MRGIGEISIRDIQQRYKLGFNYAENIIKRLEEIGYIKKINDYHYQIIQTEQEIDNYIKCHIKELRPQKYNELGIKDNGQYTFKSRFTSSVEYNRVILPVFVRRLLFSIPQAIVLFFLMICVFLVDLGKGDINFSFSQVILDIFSFAFIYIFFALPANIIIRICQSKIYKMKFKDFMLLPKNWFFKRCQDTFELHKILIDNKIKFHFGTYNEIFPQVERILQQKKSLAEHYANIANNANSQNELYQSIDSCIATLEWMVQFEKFGFFPDGQKPSDDITVIKEGIPMSVERFNRRMKEMQNTNLNYENIEEREIVNYDYMEGHDFEYFCADVLRKNGFENVEVTQGSGDHGIDILAEKDGITYAIQCKRYDKNISNAAVQQAYTGKGIYKKDIAVVLTNRYFTPQAKEEAAALGVKLWDRDKLNEMISK